MMRKHNPQVRGDGFALVMQVAPEQSRPFLGSGMMSG